MMVPRRKTWPGEMVFRRIYRIRKGRRLGEEDAKLAALAYPYAIEKDKMLYVGYSVGRLDGNRNSAELAVIPVASLAAP